MGEMQEGTSNRRFSELRRSIVMIICATAVLTGCESMQMSGRRPSEFSLEDATASYDADRYEQAFAQATEVHRAAPLDSRLRDQAGYIAGLSAFQLQRYHDATQYLRPATRCADPSIAGPASATMGLISLEYDRPEEAVVHFTRAHDLLTGDDRSEAAFHAARTYQRLGRTSQARKYFMLARVDVQDDDKRNEINDAIQTTGWTVQLGAFTTLSTAMTRVEEYEKTTAARSFGNASIIRKLAPDGRELYYVQVGTFFDHQLAERAQARIPGLSIVTRIDGPRTSRYAGAEDEGG